MKHNISRPFRRAQFYGGGSNASSSSLLQHLKWESHPRPSHHHSKTSFWLLLVWSQQSWLFIFYCVKKDTTKKLKIGRQRPTTLLCVFLVSLVGRTHITTTIYCKTYDVWRVKKLKYVGNWKWYLLTDIFAYLHTFSILKRKDWLPTFFAWEILERHIDIDLAPSLAPESSVLKTKKWHY